LRDMSWLNEPDDWAVEGDVLSVVTQDRTDFWRETFYSWITDNGHFYHRPVTGDFSAEAVVSAAHEVRFDQAGMMLRADERTWLKTGLEVTSGAVQVSTICTRDFSDVSITPLPEYGDELALRISRFGNAVSVHCRQDENPWQLLRLCHLDLPETVAVGLMCCSPERAGLRATFRGFTVGPPISRDGLE
jgi:uncharacterized protein